MIYDWVWVNWTEGSEPLCSRNPRRKLVRTAGSGAAGGCDGPRVFVRVFLTASDTDIYLGLPSLIPSSVRGSIMDMVFLTAFSNLAGNRSTDPEWQKLGGFGACWKLKCISILIPPLSYLFFSPHPKFSPMNHSYFLPEQTKIDSHLPEPKVTVTHDSYCWALNPPLNFVVDGGCMNPQNYAFLAGPYAEDWRADVLDFAHWKILHRWHHLVADLNYLTIWWKLHSSW